MSQVKSKAESLYNKLRAAREKLVKQYEASGNIRYDVATGICPPSAAGVSRTVAPAPRTKTIPNFKEDGTILAGTRTVLNFAAISAANIADGITSGTMKDAFAARATGKVVEFYANDNCLRFGGILLWEVPCLLRIMDDINSVHGGIVPARDATATSRGVVHSLPGKIETSTLVHRGLFKPVNYRGDADLLKNPVSMWSQSDKSLQSIFLLGQNSLIRMWGKDQVIDLNGKTVDVHERPNIFAGFSVIVDLSDGHFASLSSKGAQNAHIYSSTGLGRLGRNNHFAIRGHFVRKLLVEGIQSGDHTAKNKGSYFGTAIFNDCSEVVFKDVHQEQLNHQVSRSSLGLSWYADLTMHEVLFAKLELPSTFNAAGANTNYPWMKWVGIASGDTDTFGNGKTTPYPIIKTAAELETAGVTAGQGQTVRDMLIAAQEAYRSSSKNADDTYIQVHVAFGANFTPLTNGRVERKEQIARTTNLVVANPIDHAEGNIYPDSISYGFRAGSTPEGVQNLASSRGGTAQEVYLIDCSFEKMGMSMMEAVSMKGPFGLYKTFNGQALRPLGYSNSRNPASGIAASTMHISQDYIAELFSSTDVTKIAPASSPYVNSVLDTAAKAFTNTDQTSFTNTYADAKAVHGLYKGHDVFESSLATLTAIGRLAKHFTAAGPAAVLSGLNNTNMDIAILAWRYSMMEALGASTANHVGLKGGYAGDINDRLHAPDNAKNDGEIYPWYKSKATSGAERVDGTQAPTTTIDKDADYTAAAAVDPTNFNRAVLTEGYLACALPEPSNNLFKFAFELVDPDNQYGGVKAKLVKAVSGAAVTYGDCATLLGFDTLGLNKMSSASPVEYTFVENVDGQNHVHKGVFGIRFDQITDCAAIRCRVTDIESEGFSPETRFIADRATALATGVTDAQRPGSHANDIYGLSVNGVTNCYVEDFDASSFTTLGDIFGIQVQGQCKNIEIDGASFSALHAGEIAASSDSFELSGKIGKTYNVGPQKALGLRVSSNSKDIKLKNVSGSDISSPATEFAKVAQNESI